MNTMFRLPQAPTQPSPERGECPHPFRIHFARAEGRHALDRLPHRTAQRR